MGIEIRQAALGWNMYEMGNLGPDPRLEATQAKTQLSSEGSSEFSALKTANLIRSAVRGSRWETYSTEGGTRKFLPLDEAFAKTAVSHARRLVETSNNNPEDKRTAIQCLGILRECTVVRSAPTQRNVVDSLYPAPLPAWTQPGQLGKLFDSFIDDKNDKGHIKTNSYIAAEVFVKHSLPDAADAGGTISRAEAELLIGVRNKFKAPANSSIFSEKRRCAVNFKTAFDAKLSGFPAYKAALAEHRKAPSQPVSAARFETSSQMVSMPTEVKTYL